MFAVIKTGGKQYKVAKDDKVTVEKLAGEPGTVVELSEVLMIGEEGKAPTVGAPLVEKAAVFAEVVEQSRADKIIIFKKKRRHNYRRKAGHRQHQTVLRITGISATGTKPKAAAKKAAASAGKKEGDIFESKKVEYKPSEQRKTDQTAVDKSLMEAVKKHADGKLLKQYLRTGFGLSKGEYPHKMVF